jgi:hypothetical protein
MKIQPHFFYPISYEKPFISNENCVPYFLSLLLIKVVEKSSRIVWLEMKCEEYLL